MYRLRFQAASFMQNRFAYFYAIFSNKTFVNFQDGEVVGINSMTVAVATGISFAIPSNIAKKFLADFEQHEKKTEKSSWFGGVEKAEPKAKRRALGITIVPLDAQILQELRRHSWEFPQVPHGILIHSIIIGSPAHRAGIQIRFPSLFKFSKYFAATCTYFDR